MRSSMLLAVMAGVAWGACGYFEKAGLRTLGMPPIAGITVRTAVTLVLLGVLSVPGWRLIAHREQRQGWLMLVVGGGVVAVARTDVVQAPSGTPSKNVTTPDSSEYSAPTTSRPSVRINCSSSSEPWRR